MCDTPGELTDEMPGRQHVKVVVPFIDLHHFDADARVYELKQLLQSDDRVRLPFELLHRKQWDFKGEPRRLGGIRPPPLSDPNQTTRCQDVPQKIDGSPWHKRGL